MSSCSSIYPPLPHVSVNGERQLARWPHSQVIHEENDLTYLTYSHEEQLSLMNDLISKDLSEPYSIFTYRYFVNFWPQFALLAMSGDDCVGCIICKLNPDKQGRNLRGYIAMLAVDVNHRKKKIGSKLVELIISGMKAASADLIVLEAEVSNKGALSLYDKLNFVRETRLPKYYLSGVDAYRLKLWLTLPFEQRNELARQKYIDNSSGQDGDYEKHQEMEQEAKERGEKKKKKKNKKN